MSRGYGEMMVFHDMQDWQRFINDLEKIFVSHGLVLHGYCLMGNHYHLFTETPNANLQQAMHRLLTRYACYYKAKYGHKSKVFEKRYKAILVDTDLYALDLLRYIHRNPIGIYSDNPEQWQYSSYAAYLGYVDAPEFLDCNLMLNRFARNEITIAREKIKEHMTRDSGSAWYPEDYILGQTVMGSKEFVEGIQDYLPDDVNAELRGLIYLKQNQVDICNNLKTILGRSGFNIKLQFDFLLLGLRSKTYLTTSEINYLLGCSLTKSTMSRKIHRVKELAKSDKRIAELFVEMSLG